MEKWRDLTRRLLACFVVIGALAACTPGGGPVVTDSPSVSASASSSVPGSVSPSASPSASVDVLAALPDAAKSPGLDGAIATAEFFVELYGTMLQTGDTRLWDALSGPDCEYCTNASTSIAEHYAKGESASGGKVDVDATKTTVIKNDTTSVVVRVRAHQEPWSTVSGGVSSSPTGGGPVDTALKLSWLEDRWIVGGVQVIEAEDS